MEVEPEYQGGQGKDCQDSIVERKNPQDSSRVKLAEKVGTGKGVIKNSCDQEAGEDKEEIDTVRPKGKNPVHKRLEGRVWVGGK